MKYTRTISLVAAFFIVGSALFISAALAADGSYMGVKDTYAAYVETSMQNSMDKYEFLMITVATPGSMEVAVGDTVTWRNYQRPKFPVVLVSDDGLWDDQTIYYGKIFTYTFEEPGIYTFSAKNNPAISGIVVVTEKRMPSVSETPIKKDIMVPMQVPVMGEETGERVQSMEKAQVQIREQAATRTNEFLIIRTATPEILEIYAGEAVTWKNYQRPKFPVVLVSDDGLWDDQTIYYGMIFTYTFEDTGIYSFSAKNNPAISGTVVVTEKRMPSVSETPIKKDIMVPMPVPIMGEDTGERVQTMDQVQEQMEESIMARSNEFLIIRTVTPELIEIDAGETVTWRNLQRPKFPVVLVSDDGLWDDQTIYYGKIFSYTFKESGIYAFSVVDKPLVKVTVVVK